jgi:hypothetical protein
LQALPWLPRRPGHIGIVYQAANPVYPSGLSTLQTHVLLRGGTVLDDRTAQKIRKQERG